MRAALAVLERAAPGAHRILDRRRRLARRDRRHRRPARRRAATPSRSCTARSARASGPRTSPASRGRSTPAPGASWRWTPTSRTTRPTSRGCSRRRRTPTSCSARATSPAAACRTGAACGASSAGAGRGTPAGCSALAVRDLTGGFKCFRREVLEAIDLPTIRSRGYAFQVELTHRAIRAGFSVVELPIVFRDRRLGTSKMTPRIAVEAALLVPQLRFGRRARISGQRAAPLTPAGRAAAPIRRTCGRRISYSSGGSRIRARRSTRGTTGPGPCSAAGSPGSLAITALLLAAVWVIASLSTPDATLVHAARPAHRPEHRAGRRGPVSQRARARAARDGLRRRLHRRQLAAAGGRALQRRVALDPRQGRPARDRVRHRCDGVLAADAVLRPRVGDEHARRAARRVAGAAAHGPAAPRAARARVAVPAARRLDHREPQGPSGTSCSPRRSPRSCSPSRCSSPRRSSRSTRARVCCARSPGSPPETASLHFV